MADRRAYPLDLVCGYRGTDAASADHDPSFPVSRHNRSSDRDRKIGIVVGTVIFMCADIDHFVASSLQPCGRSLLQFESAVVGADYNPHYL